MMTAGGSDDLGNPESLAQNAAQPTLTQLEECKQLGINTSNCSDAAILAKNRSSPELPISDEAIKQIQDHQNQISNSMYMISIGAAIAGTIAFLTFTKKIVAKKQR